MFVITSAPATAAPITGKLDTAGYTVIGLAANGQARTVIASDGNFSLEPPAETVTLHLRGPDGTYAGPVVLREEGGEVAQARSVVTSAKRKVRRAKRAVRAARTRLARADGAETEERASKRLRRAKRRLRKARRRLAQAKNLLEQAQKLEAERPNRAILGIRSGASLGPIQVRSSAGYAITSPIGERRLDTKRVAFAREGVPIGARNFGLVTSRPFGNVAGDLDLDGVPDPLDIDDDGDEILDNLDLSAAGGTARAAQTGGGCGPSNFYCQTIASSLAPTRLEDAVNVNAGSTAAQIDSALSNFGALRFAPLSESAELDCGGGPDPGNPDGWLGGLSYCTRGGTGIASAGGPGPPFPGPPGGEFDPDADGYGTFPKPSFVAPRATTAEIKTGDILTQRVTDDGTEIPVPATVNFVFATVPALVSYSDTVGNCARVSGTAGDCATVFSYPIAPGAPGTIGNGFPVSAPAGQDVVVTLTFWHPQRQAIPDSEDPPTALWMDIGHLTWTAYAPAAGHPAIAGGCPQATFSTADPNLAPPVLPLLGTGGLADLADDQQTSPGNTLSYSLNLSQCLAANGLSFNSGEQQMINFMAVAGATDIAEQQGFTFKRQ